MSIKWVRLDEKNNNFVATEDSSRWCSENLHSSLFALSKANWNAFSHFKFPDKTRRCVGMIRFYRLLLWELIWRADAINQVILSFLTNYSFLKKIANEWTNIYTVELCFPLAITPFRHNQHVILFRIMWYVGLIVLHESFHQLHSLW